MGTFNDDRISVRSKHVITFMFELLQMRNETEGLASAIKYSQYSTGTHSKKDVIH